MEGLDSDEFGPMIGADDFELGNDEFKKVRKRQLELEEQKRILEAEFGQQRAKFMELFKQKEDALRQAHDELTTTLNRCSSQEMKLKESQQLLKQLKAEVRDVSTAAAISEANRMDEVEKIQRRYQEETASLHSIIKELTMQLEQSSPIHYEQEIVKLIRQKEKLETELQEIRAARLNRDRDGILSSFTKTLQKRVTNQDPRELEEENLEYSMKKAQEDAEKLRSVVTPFEEEINSLKEELRHCKEHIKLLKSNELKSLRRNSTPSQGVSTDLTNEISASDDDGVADHTAQKDEIEFMRREDWNEMKKLVALSGKPCAECMKLEKEIKSLRESVEKMNHQLNAKQRHLENEKLTRLQLEKYKDELESNLLKVANEARSQLSSLTSKVHESERFLDVSKKQFSEERMHLKEQLDTMRDFRQELQNELTRLQNEIDELVGKHSKFAQELQEEFINLPDNLEDIQILVLKCREEIITAKLAKEHVENVLQRELDCARDQLHQQNIKEGKLAQEINQLREELAIRNSLYSELGHRIKDSENMEIISSHQKELDECKIAKGNLERTLHQLQAKVENLKTDLSNSEAAQQDFMKFSQSLQIELNKMRLSESEVRWQNLDDVTECGSCHKSFALDLLTKGHCLHCGHVFCEECLSLSIPSGPKLRLANVCQSCYQNLVKVRETDVNHSSPEETKEHSH